MYNYTYMIEIKLFTPINIFTLSIFYSNKKSSVNRNSIVSKFSTVK